MIKNLIIAILLFTVITFLIWKFFNGFYKKEFSKKMRNSWTSRTFHWSGLLFFSGGLTVMIIFLLKEVNILTF